MRSRIPMAGEESWSWVSSHFLFSTSSKGLAPLGKTVRFPQLSCPASFANEPSLLLSNLPLGLYHPRSLLCHVCAYTPQLSSPKASGLVWDWVWLPKFSLLCQVPLRGKVQGSFLMTEGEAMVKSTASSARFSEINFQLCHSFFMKMPSYDLLFESVCKTLKWTTENPYLIWCSIKWVNWRFWWVNHTSKQSIQVQYTN